MRLRSNPQIKASVSWKLLPSNKRIQEAFIDFQSAHKALCEKYGSKDDIGQPILIPIGENGGTSSYVFDGDNRKSFNEEYKELEDSKIVLPEPTVKVSEFGGITITVDDLMQLVGPVLLDA